MRDLDETDRTLGDLARLGTVASVDLAAARVTVAAGDLVTGPVPWLAMHAGGLRCWSPPSVGEQVLLIAPEGEIAAAVALTGLFSTAHPAPAADAAHSFHFDDGAVIRYSPADGLSVVLPAGGKVAITAPGGVAVTGDIAVTGKVTATGDVTGNGTSLHSHTHRLVKAGTDVSGPPS